MTRASMTKVFLGSFFIQSSWSFEKMQSLGFAAAISPALDEVYAGDEGKKAEALKRHLEFYNAHPYMASPILGASIRMEEEAKGGADEGAGPRFKSRVTGPYSAIGDSFFWGSIRPLASVIGVVVSLFWGMWGPVAFLVLYNAFHLWMRLSGLKKGYELGEGVVGYIKSLELPQWSKRAKYIGTAVLALSSSVAAWAVASGFSEGYSLWGARAWYFAMTAAVLGATFLLSLVMRKGVRVTRLFYAVVVPLIIYGVLYG